MPLSKVKEWFAIKPVRMDRGSLAISYYIAFSTESGRHVLDHLIDTLYCSVYEGIDPIAGIVHNSRRSVIHEILQNIDYGRNPEKHKVQVQELEMERP